MEGSLTLNNSKTYKYIKAAKMTEILDPYYEGILYLIHPLLDLANLLLDLINPLLDPANLLLDLINPLFDLANRLLDIINPLLDITNQLLFHFCI